MDKDVLDYGYGFFWQGEDYIYASIEAAETAGMMAVGFGDGQAPHGIFIYPYFDGVRASRCGARVIITVDGTAQCGY